MGDSDVLDLRSLDRDVARAVGQVEEWRSGLNDDPGTRSQEDPFDGVRRVSAKSTRDALLAYEPSDSERLLRDSLLRWTAALVQTRIGLADDVAFALEANAPRGRFEGEETKLVSWREAWRRLVAARTVAETRLWLDAAGDAAPSIAALNRTRASRRLEVARRLGAPHPWALLLSATPAAIGRSARRLLDVTEAIAEAQRKESAPDAGGAASVIHDALARGAAEGWPARLSPSWLERTFSGFVRGLPLRIERLPPALGAASFARALRAFGFSARIASAPASLPFVVAREPAFIGAHRDAFLFASLAADPDFQQRMLGVSRRTALDQSRQLARTALFEARLHAARIVLSTADKSDDSAFEEMGTRLFGRPLDLRLRGAWPESRDDEPARFVALLQVPSARTMLIDRFDVDWYRNPRGWAHLRAEGSRPAWEAVDDEALGPWADGLGRAFEEALG
ncbi:MAG TPA: hypothetical protein VEK07_20590 [Polyangiaceae bacterium]|nr:hypothetical protein [Polyangiaceae bacterium]